jgi:hypothetical protein
MCPHFITITVCLKNISITGSSKLEKTSVSHAMRGEGEGGAELILNWSPKIIIRQVLCSHTMFKPDCEHKTKSFIPLSFCASLKSYRRGL